TNGLNQLPKEMYPHGTAMNNTLQQVSGAIGSALLITIMNGRTESKAAELTAQTIEKMSPTEEISAVIEKEILNESMLNGINFSFLVSTIIICVAFIITLFMNRVTTPAAIIHSNDADTPNTNAPTH